MPASPDPSTPPSLQVAQELIDRFLDSIDPAFRAGGAHVDDDEVHRRNVALLHGVFEAVGLGDFEAYGRTCHEDVTLEIAGSSSVPFLGTWEGRAEVVDATRRNFGMLESQQPEIRSLAAQGDHVVVVMRETGRYIATGDPYAYHSAVVFTFEDGLVRRIREFIADGPPAVA
ncbi:MAG: hypothetical protein BGO49_12405 [Planctomycetales bacterium 71-10]|nr:MAG: hypothetical protein BGO49_12405 [Planctomycetales bacterium 71-10]